MLFSVFSRLIHQIFDFTLNADEMALLTALDLKEPLIGKPETPELVKFSLTW